MKTRLTLIALMLCAGTALAQDRPPPPRPGEDRPPPRWEERGQQDRSSRDQPPRDNAKRYSLEQATSDRAQLHTIAIDGLAYLTGDFGYDTFLPQGKVFGQSAQ